MASTVCQCGAEHPAGAHYYVSVVDAGRTGLLAGPFATHGEALALVGRAREEAKKVTGGWSHFYSFGTVAMANEYTKPGLLNERLGVEVAL